MPSVEKVRSLVLTSVLAVVVTACGAESPDPKSAADTATTQPSAAPDPDAAEPEAGGSQESSAAVPEALDFSAETVAGDEFDGASLAGKPSVLWFWAPWCPTCRGQIEGVSALAEEYGDEVSFVGVGSLDETSAIEGFAADVPADFPHLLDSEGEVWRHFAVVEQSTYVVLDADSEVVSEGYLSDSELADMVSALAG